MKVFCKKIKDKKKHTCFSAQPQGTCVEAGEGSQGRPTAGSWEPGSTQQVQGPSRHALTVAHLGVPGLASWGETGDQVGTGRVGGRFSLGAGGTEAAFPPRDPIFSQQELPGSGRGWGEACRRHRPPGSLLGDRSDQQCTATLLWGRVQQASCPPGPRWPWTRWGQPCPYGQLPLPAWLRRRPQPSCSA